MIGREEIRSLWGTESGNTLWSFSDSEEYWKFKIVHSMQSL